MWKNKGKGLLGRSQFCNSRHLHFILICICKSQDAWRPLWLITCCLERSVTGISASFSSNLLLKSSWLTFGNWRISCERNLSKVLNSRSSLATVLEKKKQRSIFIFSGFLMEINNDFTKMVLCSGWSGVINISGRLWRNSWEKYFSFAMTLTKNDFWKQPNWAVFKGVRGWRVQSVSSEKRAMAAVM